MKSSLRSVLPALLLLAVAVVLARPGSTPSFAQQPGGANTSDLAAIRARAESYEKAYNKHDAAAVAEHWSEDAVYVREDGERVKGRAAIQKVFEQIFADDNQVQIAVTITDLRLITDNVAVEDGKVEVAGEGPTLESTYTAVNVKKNGVWYVDTVRETDLPAPPSHYDHLKELSWMIGEWASQEGPATVKAKCEWAKNKNFITRSFTIAVKGQLEISGTQVIGYDASTGEIKSWMFDSDGGVAEGVWSRSGNSWSVKMSAVTPEGAKGSAVHVMTYVNEKEFTWHTVNRELDGEILPNIAEVRILRVTGE